MVLVSLTSLQWYTVLACNTIMSICAAYGFEASIRMKFRAKNLVRACRSNSTNPWKRYIEGLQRFSAYVPLPHCSVFLLFERSHNQAGGNPSTFSNVLLVTKLTMPNLYCLEALFFSLLCRFKVTPTLFQLLTLVDMLSRACKTKAHLYILCIL
ncbi:hypothetical protein B0J14DRAFT_218020 [Halenospora varia]|nr:hypothetical protein B0J14DRAFT_218020 [Halenospora varia]